jgi:hypothetical protein
VPDIAMMFIYHDACVAEKGRIEIRVGVVSADIRSRKIIDAE